MSNLRMALFTVLISLLIITCQACGMKDGSEYGDNKIIAKINKYDLTVADFKSETQGMPDGLSDADFEKSKESLLDGIITKKVLLQEAQAQNFDKDRAFIKEIERYWEQALLKSLYNKKSQEISRKIEADKDASKSGVDKAVMDKRVREELSAWIEGLKARSDIKKYTENLKEIKQK